MRRPLHPRPTRAGFTLVELLVVITIIVVLVSLTAAAVFKAFGQGPIVRARNDIVQLAAGIQAFKTHYQVSHVPSVIRLRPRVALAPTGDYNPSDAIDVESLTYLKRVWPRLGSNPANPSIPLPIDWTPVGGPGELLGPQCLVFFLGGARVGGGCVGFSPNPQKPVDILNLSNRVGPFFDFPPERLTQESHPKFLDVWEKQPYLYFSSGKAGNDYPTANGQVVGITVGSVTVHPFQVGGDLPTVTSTSRLWENKNGFQIICAGPDNEFGPGGVNWFGFKAGTQTGAPTQQGRDDIVNFRASPVGAE